MFVSFEKITSSQYFGLSETCSAPNRDFFSTFCTDSKGFFLATLEEYFWWFYLKHVTIRLFPLEELILTGLRAIINDFNGFLWTRCVTFYGLAVERFKSSRLSFSAQDMILLCFYILKTFVYKFVDYNPSKTNYVF